MSDFTGQPIRTSSAVEPGQMYLTQFGWLVHEWPPQSRWQRFWRWITRNPLPPSGMDRLAAALEDTA